MSKISLEKLTHKELVTLQDEIVVAIKQRKEDSRADVRRKIAELVAENGFDVSDFLNGKRGGKRGPVAVKYRNPKDPSQAWTGRGRKPNWLVDALKKGQKIDSFAV